MAITLNGTTGITAPGTETFGDGTAIGGATNPIVSMAKGANNYVQGYIVNNTDAANASADLVAYPSNGTDSSGWVDMGITGPTFSQAAFSVTGPNEAYLFGSAPSGASKTGNLVIATDSTGTANAIQFYTGGFNQAKSAARMTIDGSGNLLLSTTASTNGKLTILKNSLYNSQSGHGIALLSNDNNAYTSMYMGADDTNNIGYIQTAQHNTGYARDLAINPNGGNLLVGLTTKIVSASSICEMSGSIGIGIRSTGGDTAPAGFFWNNATTGNNVFLQFATEAGGTVRGSITYNRGGGLTAYNTTSDYRAKTVNGAVQNALDKVAQLKPSTGRMNDAEYDIDFFVAHELQEVVPSAVTGEKDEVNEDGSPKYQMVDKSALIPLLTAAIQEQQAIIEQLRADVEALKA